MVGMLPSLHIWMAMDGSVSSEIDVCVCVCARSLATTIGFRIGLNVARQEDREGGKEGADGGHGRRDAMSDGQEGTHGTVT